MLLTSCSQPASKLPDKMSSIEAFTTVSSDASIVVMDVRTIAEYNEGHIKGSILVPLDTIQRSIEGILSDKNTTIFVVCRSGNRSAQAKSMLQKMGYANVTDIGSVFTWPEPLVVPTQ